MNSEQVTNKIISEAQGEADAILAEARQKLEGEKAQFDKQLREYQEQSAELARRAGKDRRSHILAAARMDIARSCLAEKRKLLDEVFDKARERFSKMPDEEYRQLMRKLIQEAVETGDEEVMVGQTEQRINQGFIKQVNRELGPGYKGNLRLAARKLPISAGFVLKRGNIMTNASVDVMLDEAREELETEIAKSLFEK
jgi:V/A-type H+-transporting ATPase subunit E